ncbi:MAG: hypothetical protein Q9202_003894 [Teloschistes flavicans]
MVAAKSSGYDLQAWCFVSKVNIRQIDGKELDYEMGMLKQYCHSQGAYRNFCQRCGATVFWHDDERPGVVDVSVGLLDAEEGARSEDWLEWATARVSFEEFASNKTLVSSELQLGTTEDLTKGQKDRGTSKKGLSTGHAKLPSELFHTRLFLAYSSVT